jgi:hypothetical protein
MELPLFILNDLISGVTFSFFGDLTWAESQVIFKSARTINRFFIVQKYAFRFGRAKQLFKHFYVLTQTYNSL